MRILKPFDQAGRMLDRLAKTDIVATHPQQFPARFVVFHNLKAQSHRIESPGKKRFVPQRV